MSTTTSRDKQLRLEKKRRRRAERKARRLAAQPSKPSVSLSSEQAWSHRVVLAPAGRQVEPELLAALDVRGTMTDALLKLMERYVWWPPAPSEIPELETWLELGAAVWNATVRSSTSNQLNEQLEAIADGWDGPDDDEPEVLVEEIAERKLHLFADDHRVVGSVTVRVNGGNAEVEAMSLQRLR